MIRFFTLPQRRPKNAGISVVEMILSVATLGLIATVATMGVTNVREGAQKNKLNSDVQALNSAIRIYLANGGNMEGVTTADAALLKLKSSRSKSDKELHVGAPPGRMIDNRVATAPVAADSWKARAQYNSASQRFETVENQAGIEFILDDSLAEVSPDLETRENTVSYAKTSSWVWDHTSTINPGAPAGPSTFGTNPNPANSVPSTAAPEPEPEPETTPPVPRLPYPQIDKDNGPHPEEDFPLAVTVTNPPASADGAPVFQINSDPWMPYTGPVSVPMNSSIRVQFMTVDPSRYQDSSVKYAYFYPVPSSLSGMVNGDFHSPSGGSNLQYQIKNGKDYFQHGDPEYILDGEPVDSGAPNSLEFRAQNFSDIAPGEKFKLGDLNYHNGNSYYDSHATGVSLNLRIMMPDRGENIDFDLHFDLVNTENDPDDPAASADYVKITNLQQNINLQINGVNYRIALEFGATDSFGFSSSSQFHVYEGATGVGEILGTFLPN